MLVWVQGDRVRRELQLPLAKVTPYRVVTSTRRSTYRGPAVQLVDPAGNQLRILIGESFWQWVEPARQRDGCDLERTVARRVWGQGGVRRRGSAGGFAGARAVVGLELGERPSSRGIVAAMNLSDALARLESLTDPKTHKRNARLGAVDHYGVKLGDIRKVAKQIKMDPDLSRALWASGNIDARLLSILIIKPESLTTDELDARVRANAFAQVADWLSAYLVKKHPGKEVLRQGWMADDHPMAARAGWSLTAERVVKSPEGLDLWALLDRIEAEMGGACPEVQWTMNMCLAQIGIESPDHRQRALAIGHALGVLRDYPTSKGCTSPFAPIWIEEMVRRQG